MCEGDFNIMTYIYTHTYIHTHTYIYLYTHTNIHTHTHILIHTNGIPWADRGWQMWACGMPYGAGGGRCSMTYGGVTYGIASQGVADVGICCAVNVL